MTGPCLNGARRVRNDIHHVTPNPAFLWRTPSRNDVSAADNRGTGQPGGGPHRAVELLDHHTVLVCKASRGALSKGDVMSVVKIIEVVGRSTASSDDAVKSALSEAQRTLRDVKALDVVSVGLRGDNLDEWGALVRISFLVENVTD